MPFRRAAHPCFPERSKNSRNLHLAFYPFRPISGSNHPPEIAEPQPNGTARWRLSNHCLTAETHRDKWVQAPRGPMSSKDPEFQQVLPAIDRELAERSLGH